MDFLSCVPKFINQYIYSTVYHARCMYQSTSLFVVYWGRGELQQHCTRYFKIKAFRVNVSSQTNVRKVPTSFVFSRQGFFDYILQPFLQATLCLLSCGGTFSPQSFQGCASNVLAERTDLDRRREDIKGNMTRLPNIP